MAEAAPKQNAEGAPTKQGEGAPGAQQPKQPQEPMRDRRREGRPVLMAERYLIHPSRHLPELDTPSARAYEVEDRRDPQTKYFALICTPGLAPRVSMLAVLKATVIRGLIKMIEWEVVDWPPLGRRCMALLYERPMGGRVTGSDTGRPVRINEYDMPRRVIEPVARALKELGNRNLSHRAVRPDNLYYMDAEKTLVVLGDCVSTPPGFDQPMIFEPIERSMCSPGGRGRGTASDDVYALGVTIVSLLLGGNPVAKLDEDTVFHMRVENGTYATLVGNTRIPVTLLEPLRGLLSDDPFERWGAEELDLWLAGKRQTPIQRKPAHKTQVPFAFAGRDHFTARTISRAITRHVADAVAVIKDGSLAAWVRRSLEMPDVAEAISRAQAEAEKQPKTPLGSDHYLVTKISILLDPKAPIRYKGVSCMPEGFGSLFAVEAVLRGNHQVPAEILRLEFPTIWFEAQSMRGAEASVLARNFSGLRQLLSENAPGFGVERCLYELNTALPCQSPLIENDYVVTIEELLPFLDKAAGRVDNKTKPLDRHLIAFIATRFDEDIEPHLKALADPKESIAIIGMLSLLAFLQWKLKPEPLYGLASWMGGLLGPAIETYHSRTTRREIEREIPKLVRQGSLPELFDLIDNAEKRRADTEGYTLAQERYQVAETEIREIEGHGEGETPEERQMRIGQQAAAMSSVVIAMLVVSFLFFLETW